MTLRIVVTGKYGQLTQSLQRLGRCDTQVIAVGRPELNLENPSSVRAVIEDARPDVIVSAAAYTAVDQAEENPELALAINVEGAAAVAKTALGLGVPIVHISTDYVFSGEKTLPYVETDVCDPISIYGSSKFQGEQLVAKITDNHVILRTSWIYSPFGSNFVKTMVRLAETNDVVRVVDDQYGCPSSANDIANAIVSIAAKLSAEKNSDLRGIFHLSGNNSATWADFAEVIFDCTRKLGVKSASVDRITTKDYPTLAKRPANSRLSNEKLHSVYGVYMPDWQKSIMIAVRAILHDKF